MPLVLSWVDSDDEIQRKSFPDFPTRAFDWGPFLYRVGLFLRKTRVEMISPFETFGFLVDFNPIFQRLGIRFCFWHNRSERVVKVTYYKINKKRMRPVFRKECNRALTLVMRMIEPSPEKPCWYMTDRPAALLMFSWHNLHTIPIKKADDPDRPLSVSDYCRRLATPEDCWKFENLFSMHHMIVTNDFYHLTGDEDTLLTLACCYHAETDTLINRLPVELFQIILTMVLCEYFYERIGYRLDDTLHVLA